jgi:hypothetical protein
MEFGLVTQFIDRLQIITTRNYDAIANLYIFKSVEHKLSSRSVYISRFLVTDPNNVLCSLPYCPANVSQLAHCANSLTPRLAAISHQPPCLLFTD